MQLVIVESPTKAKTIGKFLGKQFKVESSYGHIRDLPKSRLGIDLEHDFEPHYIVPMKQKKRVTELKKIAAKATTVILATDEDREGEAIAYHLMHALNLSEDRTKRIAFHEITKSAITHSLEHPRALNVHLVDAQQARRILDRLVGYKLSPFLWKKVMSRLSAGRVQSVALRLVVEREAAIRAFIPQEYWTIAALCASPSEPDMKFEAMLSRIDGKIIPKFDIHTKEEADTFLRDLQGIPLTLSRITRKEVQKHPLPPFTTSTLQQAASQRLHFSAKQTMMIAQNLYEHGHITYMRTDSVNLSKESTDDAVKWITDTLGAPYASHAPRFFKTTSRLAQEAHEAIRPTNPHLTPESFTPTASEPRFAKQERKLYELIWQRFLASQLPPARFDSMRVELSARSSSHEYGFHVNGTTLLFDGFLKIWPGQFEETRLPSLTEGETLFLHNLSSLQHFTEPPARYNEASLIKALEEYGIGRPSTYAPTLSVIQTRNYVTKNEARRFQPTEIGELVNTILVSHFPEIVDIQFTAKMEGQFDAIAEGKENWRAAIKEFYEPFAKNLEQKYAEVENQKPIEEPTNELCEACGKPMIIKYGRFGKFMACSGFPDCKTTKTIPMKDTSGKTLMCPKCNEGTIIARKTKRGRIFYGCARYPACDYASWKKPGTGTDSLDEAEQGKVPQESLAEE